MNPEEKTAGEVTKKQERLPEFSLRAVPSGLRITGGREIPFRRAILSLSNTGNAPIVKLVPHATLAQEGGSVQDVTEVLSRTMTVASLSPGETVTWDVYDLLLAAHPGVASKIHLWGYKAILNWWFDLAAWAEYHFSDVDIPMHTAIFKWKLRWIPPNGTLDEIDLSIEAKEG